jgi:hypothetical protein
LNNCAAIKVRRCLLMRGFPTCSAPHATDEEAEPIRPSQRTGRRHQALRFAPKSTPRQTDRSMAGCLA